MADISIDMVDILKMSSNTGQYFSNTHSEQVHTISVSTDIVNHAYRLFSLSQVPSLLCCVCRWLSLCLCWSVILHWILGVLLCNSVTFPIIEKEKKVIVPMLAGILLWHY